MHDNQLPQFIMTRQSVLPFELSMSEVFDYLGLGGIQKYETELLDRINIDKMPIRIKDKNNKLVDGCLIYDIELHEKAYRQFDKTTPFIPNNRYKILSVVNDTSDTIIGVSTNNIIITNSQMYATRDEITEYFRQDIQTDLPTLNTKTKSTKPKPESKMDKRLRTLELYCKKIAKEKGLPNSQHQTIYDSFQPPLTKVGFYKELSKYKGMIFNCNPGDFYADKRVKIKFNKAARNK